MPKEKENLVTRAKNLIKTDKSFEVQSKSNSVEIFCKLCSSKFKIDEIHLNTQFTSHVKSAKHKKAVEQNVLQPSISGVIANANANISKMDNYSTKLATAFLRAGIPIFKLQCPSIKNFFLEEHNEVLPSINTFYNKIDAIYNNTLQKIKTEIGENPIYLIADETFDACKRYPLNILVGKIDGTASKPRLLCTIFLNKTNNTTVQQAILKACNVLYGIDIPFEKIWFFVSDQAPYMIKAGKGLKNVFPNLKHITCLIHALNRVCEVLKDENSAVNEFIAGMKSTLSKSNVRRQLYKEMCNIAFPPDVIEIRWNSWLNAAFFYANNYSVIKAFIVALEEDAKSVTDLKECITRRELESQLHTVSKFSFLTKAITSLEKQGLTVQHQLIILNDVKRQLTGSKLAKLQESLSKNPDVNFYESLPVDQKIQCEYVPMTSVDAERSFSIYKYILSDRRHNLTESHLAMLNVIQFNNSIDDENKENENE